MKIIIEAEPKEIAALVLAVQERQDVNLTQEQIDEYYAKIFEPMGDCHLAQPVHDIDAGKQL